MTPTTRLASFGLFFVVAAFPLTLRHRRRCLVAFSPVSVIDEGRHCPCQRRWWYWWWWW
jgi:hypothetical protein